MNFSADREGEEEIYALIQDGGAGDGYEFLNEPGEGMEV
jgi:hypothetical protein